MLGGGVVPTAGAGHGMTNLGISEQLEGTARYAGLLLAPAEGFGLRPRLFLPFGQKKIFSLCLCLF